jgi:DnaK suppressor protein
MDQSIDYPYFKTRLEKRLKEITEGQQTIAPVELDQSRVGRLSRMDAMQRQAMDQATARLLAKETQRIRTALKRITTGDYGYCLQCEEEIATGRLKADPSALTCIQCARAAEKS